MPRPSLASVALLVGLTSPGFAQEDVAPSTFPLELDIASTQLRDARTAEERLAAYPDVTAVLEQYASVVPGADLMLRVNNIQWASEALTQSLGAIAASLSNADALDPSAQTAMLVAALAQFADRSGLLPTPSVAHELFGAIEAFDQAASTRGQPGLRQLLAELLDDGMAGLAVDFLDEVATIESVYQTLSDVAAGDNAAINDAVDEFVGHVTDNLPALAGPSTVAIDAVRWTQENFDATTDGVGVFTNIIATGQVDQAALDRVTNRINELRHGPWGSGTARELVESWCDQLPAFGDLCTAILGTVIDIVEDGDLVGWNGWWSFRWGGIYIDTSGFGVTITPEEGHFLDRRSGQMNVTYASSTVIEGTFELEEFTRGTFRFEMLEDGTGFVGYLDEECCGRSEITGDRGRY